MKSAESLIESHMDAGAALGAAVALLRQGEIVYLSGFGATSVEENGVPVTPRTLFSYGSIAKNVCAVLIMRLVERQLLNLDAPILQYLPNLPVSNADYGARITLRHLLSHTSGLPMGGKYWGPRDLDSLRRFMYEQLPYYTFLSEPGTVHLYSNTIFCIAGHIAEVVTGQYYDDLVREYVCAPLNMNRTTFDPIVAMIYPLALPHDVGPNGELCVMHRMSCNASGHPSSFGYTSVSDLANLAQMYLHRGRFGDREFLRSSSVAEMQRLQTSRHIEAALHPLADNYLGYGLGFEIGAYRDTRAAGHGGMNLSYNCFFKLFPDKQAGVVVLTNYSNDPLLWKIVTSLYDHVLDLPQPGKVSADALRPPSVALDQNQLQRYSGTFLNVETAALATFTLVDSTLMVQQSGAEPIPLVPIGDHQFYAERSSGYRLAVAFIHNGQDKVAHVMIGGEPYHPFQLNAPAQPDVRRRQSFAGIYKDPTNSNQDEMFVVRLRDNALYIAEGAHEARCRAAGARSFLSELGLFEFADTERDEAKILVWGKAVRFYPVDENEFRRRGVIRYRVEPPSIPQCVDCYSQFLH